MDFDALPQQRLAIEAPLGPVLVVAGPGAGKTFCLIGRVQHLIGALGFDPARICAVTFTNKAAEEIAVRLKRSIGERAEEITRSTLHALCLRVLREHAEAAGLRKGFGVADESYQRTILARLNVPAKRRSQLLTLFGRRRLEDYVLPARVEEAFRGYASYLTQRNMVDFDDLIAKTAALFRDRPAVASAVAAQWDYLLVDEFQDLNPAQYEILKRLAAPHGNFFGVGDDEQSIYSWTGADPRVLMRFREDFGVGRPIVLDRNCRCSRQVFETARRVLAENPPLFDKQLRADRESEHDVCAHAFPDEEAEASWLLQDLEADRVASGLRWGDYAVLYRAHKIGHFLESRLVRAKVPCRLARGHSIAEDKVIGHVIAALRVMVDPTDQVALEALARRVFAEDVWQQVQTADGWDGDDLLGSVRAVARQRSVHEPDRRKLWRFVYHVENLTALPRAHRSLSSLLDALLSQSVGPYVNRLEERHDELSDPLELEGAVRLADRLRRAIAAEQAVAIEPLGGLEIALRGLLAAAGVRQAAWVPDGAASGGRPLMVRAADGGDCGLTIALFKALQLMNAPELEPALRRYVTFDLETTDMSVASCGVVEIGAARVVDGEIVARLHTLVRPEQPISAGAARVHGYTDADVRQAPAFAGVWPLFRAFVGDDLLVAHNGQRFDIPVLRRLSAGMDGAESLVFYDTLPLARSLSRDSARLEDIAARLSIDPGRSHRALDDAETLARVFLALERQRIVRGRKAVLINLLDYVGLALALDETGQPSHERRLLRDLARSYALGRYSHCLEFYASEHERAAVAAPPVEEVIDRLGGRALMDKLRATPDAAQRYPVAVGRLRALMGAEGDDDLATSVGRLLDRVALSTSDGVEVAPDRVNLLTLHSTKGLEFSRVYIVGVADHQLPGYYAFVEGRQGEIQEARRLLYVGMTRAKDRLVLTCAAQRNGVAAGGHQFLDEMRLVVSDAGRPLAGDPLPA